MDPKVTMIVIWIAAIIVFATIELLTNHMTTIWFALGSVVGLICQLFGIPVWLQIVWFVLVSGATLATLRPLFKKYILPSKVPTNVDRLIGTVGVVCEDIDNIKSDGAVFVDGKTWTARSESGDLIHNGKEVVITRIEGVKLFVSIKEG